MDFSRFKTSDWLKVGGGAGMLISTIFAWGVIDLGPRDISWGPFGFFFRGTIPWLLVVGVGVVALLLATKNTKAGTLPWPLLMIAAAALATLLTLLFLLNPTKEGIDIDRGFGSILGLLAAGAALAGSILGFKESGGDLNDLTNVNKIKAAFDQGTSMPPPPSLGTTPRPPGATPPPPPPPPPGATPPPPPA